MALKYTLHVSSQKLDNWLVEIDFPGYTGDPIELIGDRNPIRIEWHSGGNDDPFSSHIITQSATFNVYDEGLDVYEIQSIEDGSVKCRVYLNSELKHQGFIVSDGVQESDSGVSSLVTIKSTDGLDLLDSISFKWKEDYGHITVEGIKSSRKCLLNTIRRILYDTEYLDNIQPIRFSKSSIYVGNPDEIFICGTVEVNSLDIFPVHYPEFPEFLQPFKIDYSPVNDCIWWLENILKASKCWLRQRNGYWEIIDYDYLIQNDGVIDGYEITVSTADQVASEWTENPETTDLATLFINNDGYWMTKKPLGGVNITYSSVTADSNNVLLNGGFDVYKREINFWSGMLYNFPAVWTTGDKYVDINSFQPINGDTKGLAVQISTSPEYTGVYISQYNVKLDTNILFKNALLGFKWLPIEGYEVTNDGYIDFSALPIHVVAKITLNLSGTLEEYFLNEFGYWSNKNLPANAEIINQFWTSNVSVTGIYYVDFDPSKSFYPGDELVITINKIGVGVIEYVVTFDEVTPASSAKGEIASKIQDCFVGSGAGDSIYITRVENSPAINNAYIGKTTDYYKKIEIDGGSNLKHGDVLDIQFQSKGLSSDIRLPSYVGDGAGELTFQIFSKPGTVMRLDDAFFRVSDNKDLYQIRVENSKSPVESYIMGISSSFSDHFLSNVSRKKFNIYGQPVSIPSGAVFTPAPATKTDGVNGVFSIYFDWDGVMGGIIDVLNKWFTLDFYGLSETFTFVSAPDTSGNQLPAQVAETDATVFLDNILTYLSYNANVTSQYDLSISYIDYSILLTDKEKRTNIVSTRDITTSGVYYNNSVAGYPESLEIDSDILVDLAGRYIAYKTTPAADTVVDLITGNIYNNIFLENLPATGIYPDFSYVIFDYSKYLTQVYGEFIMDWRNKPRRIFDGSIDRMVQAGELVTIKGVKYIVMNASLQGDGITKILAFEAALNKIEYNVTHKGTIDDGRS